MSTQANANRWAPVGEPYPSDRTDRVLAENEDRYTVVPASFVVLDTHTGQTVQIWQGLDAEARAERHAREISAHHRRLADRTVTAPRAGARRRSAAGTERPGRIHLLNGALEVL